MSVELEIDRVVDTLATAKSGGAFKKFIDEIRFPYYRSLGSGQAIHFEFPLTAFVGQNGTGKTSALQALYGAPMGKSVEDHWFSTEVDPIRDEEVREPRETGGAKRRRTFQGRRPSIVYLHRTANGEIAYVLKYRILKRGNPDYWEPGRPGRKYGLDPLEGGGRHPTIEMEVVYRNFRYLPTSFDRCFHFLELALVRPRLSRKANSAIRRPQDYLRYKSQLLKRVLDTGRSLTIGRNLLSEAPEDLPVEALAEIGRILGKAYTNGRVIRHRLFERWGESVVFRTDSRAYSEAFAGSGESAVVTVVRAVLGAKEGSLILLDEPEVSLHPGAQQQLLRFLLSQALKKKLQIVLSTHSPAMIRGLPSAAIKLFVEGADGLVGIKEGLIPEEAFFAIGYPHSDRITVVVEDILAKALLEAVIATLGPETAALFDVRFNAGGASAIARDIAYYSRHGQKNVFVVLDGDQRIADPFDPDQAKISDLTDENLAKEVERVARQEDPL